MDFYKNARPLGIGDTPLIPYEEDFDADIYIKNEAMNVGGSIKDRSALGMILDAEERGVLHRGDTVVEATDGNMGISLAYVGIKRGYKVLLTVPDNVGAERRQLLQGLGAQLVFTEGGLGIRGAIEAAERYAERSGHLWLRQFENPANIVANGTAGEEICRQLDRVDVFVACVGTAATLVGIGKKLKEHFPNVEIVAVEPAGCPVISRGEKGAHLIEGVGGDFVPALYDKTLVDRVELVTDDEALDMFRLLNLKQGYSCGISSAANIKVATKLAGAPAYKGKNIVTVFFDGDDRYFSLLHPQDKTAEK